MPVNPCQKPPRSLLILLLVAALWVCSSDGIETRTAGCTPADQGRSFYLQGDYGAAIDAFHRHLEQAGDDYRIRRYLARSHLTLGHHAEALREIERAMALAAENAELYDILGLIHMARAFARRSDSDAGAAVAAFRKGLALDPRQAISHYNLGVVYAYQDSTRLAEHAYAAALQTDSTLAPAYGKLGLIYRRQGETAKSLAHLQKAIHYAPEDAAALYQLGLVYRSMGQYQLALAPLQKAAEFAPHSPQIHMHLGQIHLRMGHSQVGKQELRLSEHLRQRRRSALAERLQQPMGGVCLSVASVHYDTAMAYTLRGETEKAILEFHNALEINPDLREIYTELGILLARQGTLEEAARWFRQAIILAPQDPAGYARLGLVYLRQGNDTAADLTMEKVAELDEIMLEAARSLESNGVRTDPSEEKP